MRPAAGGSKASPQNLCGEREFAAEPGLRRAFVGLLFAAVLFVENS